MTTIAGKAQTTKFNRDNSGFDWGLLTIVATLLALGCVMVFSASFVQGILGFDDPLYFFVRQLVWLTVGVVVMVFAMRIPYSFWQRWSVLLMVAALLALTSVIVLGSELLGSTRTFFSGSVQPAEPAKIIIIIYISAWLASKGSRIRSIQVGLIPFSVLMGIVTVLLVAQPNISTAVILVATATIMFFIAGAELRQLLLIGVGGGATFWLVIQYSAYAGGRIERYLEAIWNPLESREWQATRTLSAIMNGGIFGQGLGNGEYKMPGGVPLGWSDNIFAVIGEELGLLGALLVVLLFSLLIYRGLRIALRAPDTFGMLLATGITALLALQALLSTSVVLAIAPATGVTLPFISYGGSSLVTILGAIGILLSISRGDGTVAAKSGAAKSSGTKNSTTKTHAARTVAPTFATTHPPTGTAPQNSYARFNFGWGNGRTRLPRTSSRTSSSPNSSSNRSSRSNANNSRSNSKRQP